MKALEAAITALVIPLVILNMLGGIVSGIWLAVIGDWGAVLIGVFSFFGSSFLISLALMPGALLVAPAALFAEKQSSPESSFSPLLALSTLCP